MFRTLWLKVFVIALILSVSSIIEFDASGRVRVNGYYRKDGTYVRPHYRTKPDGNPYNNYSFPGNYNPNTDKYSTGNPHTYLQRYSSSSIVAVLIASEKSVYTGPKNAGETLAELLRSDYDSSKLRNALAKQRFAHQKQLSILQKQLEDAKRTRLTQQNKIRKLYNEAISKGDYEKAMYYAIVIEDFSPKVFKELMHRALMQRKYRK